MVTRSIHLSDYRFPGAERSDILVIRNEDPSWRNTSVFEVIGHRGAGSLLPENTLESFRQAVKTGCPGVELDTHLSRDGKVVVIHNQDLATTTNGQGQVCDYSMSELKDLDAGNGWRIPELKEIFLEFMEGNIFFQIELKGEGTERIVPKTVEEYGMTARVRYTSFIHKRIERVHRWFGGSCGLLMSAQPLDPVALLENAGAGTLHLDRHNIDKAIVDLMHRHGKKIIAWNSIITEDIFEFLLDTGVNGATTDRPDLFLKYIKKRFVESK